jgi:hypothetical protein
MEEPCHDMNISGDFVESLVIELFIERYGIHHALQILGV